MPYDNDDVEKSVAILYNDIDSTSYHSSCTASVTEFCRGKFFLKYIFNWYKYTNGHLYRHNLKKWCLKTIYQNIFLYSLFKEHVCITYNPSP